MLLARQCFGHKTFLWAKKTPSFSGRSDNSRKKIQKSVKRPRKEIRRSRQSSASTIDLRRPWTSFSFGPLYGPLAQSSVQKCSHQSGKSLYLRTVVTSWSYCSRGKWRIDYLNDQSSPFRGSQAYFQDFSRFSWQIHGGAKPPLKGIIKARQFWLIQNNFENSNSFFTKLGTENTKLQANQNGLQDFTKCQIITSHLLTSFIRRF